MDALSYVLSSAGCQVSTRSRRGSPITDSIELSVGIAGLGYWGPNLLRNFRSVEACRVVAMADSDPARLAVAARQYPDVKCHAAAENLIDDPSVDAVVLALPAALLPGLAIRALERGKHVLVEKPMADSLDSAQRMVDASRQTALAAMVDFTFIYSPPVRYLRSLLAEGSLGEAHYFQSTRISLGRFQPDVDVIWDLAVHDVAILAFILGKDPVEVLATGRGRAQNGPVDTAHLTLSYEDGFQSFIQVSWMAPTKVRTSLLACGNGMVVYDDVQSDEKIRVYHIQERFDPGTEDAIVPTFRLGDVLIPRLEQQEALHNVAMQFVDSALGFSACPTDWRFGARVLSVIDAARRSLSEGGAVHVAAAVGKPT